MELSNGSPYGYNDMNQQGTISNSMSALLSTEEQQQQRSGLKDGGGKF